MRFALLALVAVLAGCGTSSGPGTHVQPAAERAVVAAYWRDLERGDTGAAFALLAPAEQQRVGGLSPVARVSLALGRTTARSVAANVRVVRGGACQTLTGRYDLTELDGRWRIAYMELSAAPCAK